MKPWKYLCPSCSKMVFSNELKGSGCTRCLEFLISDGGGKFVDGYDVFVEWTQYRRTAWHMKWKDADRRFQAWKSKKIIPTTSAIVEA